MNEYQIGEEACKEEAQQIITFGADAASVDDNEFFGVNDFTKFFHKLFERFIKSLHSDLDTCLLEQVPHPSDAFNFKRVLSPG